MRWSRGDAHRVHGENDVRHPAAYLFDDSASELASILELTVAVAEEDNVLDAEGGGGVQLLLLADRGQTLARHFGIRGTLVAVRADDVEDAAAFPRPFRGCPGSARFAVVRVGYHEHGPFGSLDGLHTPPYRKRGLLR